MTGSFRSGLYAAAMRSLITVMLALAVPAAAQQSGVTQQYQEAITVSRILFDVRVTDGDGGPIRGLTAADFTVQIDGRRAELETLTWVDESEGAVVRGASRDEPGRLFVVFVQADPGHHNSRVAGHIKFRQHAGELLDSLAPADRVAVFSFDSHLKFRVDFTTDREAVRDAIEASLRNHPPPVPPAVPEPSLAAHLDGKAMKRAARPEAALLHIAQALANLAGPKTILFFGWGLGERTSFGVRHRPQWATTRLAMERAQTTMFALDITEADYHDLEIPLREGAEATGGFYAKTLYFPQAAVNRLRRTLSGHYELELRRPEGVRAGLQEVTVRVARRFALVMAPTRIMLD